MKNNKMKYIITTAQKSAKANKNLLKNIKAFQKVHNIDDEGLLLFVMNGKYKDDEIVDPSLFNAGFSTVENMKLNSNLRLRDVKVQAQKIKPFHGLSSKLPRECSHILPATKLRYETLSNLSHHPRALISTGAITEGAYKLNTNLGQKAQEQHQFGFVYVTIVDNRIFHAMQVDCQKNGNFHYLNEFYSDGKMTLARPKAIVLGDLHIGILDKKAYALSLEQLRDMKPEYVALHDIFDGASVNHHESKSLISALVNVKQKKDSLSKELKMVHKHLWDMSKEFPDIKFIIPESNHDVFLRRYIDSYEFMKNPNDIMFVASIIPEVIKEKRPVLEIALSHIGPLPKNMKFLLENDEFRVAGVNIGSHGHLGVSGSRGSVSQFDRQNFKQMSGHTHRPERQANAISVGTNSILQQRYMKGPGAHAHANGIVYKDGHQMLYVMITK